MSFEQVRIGTTSTLWNAIRAAKASVIADFNFVLSPHDATLVADLIDGDLNYNRKTIEWLNDVGLKINPFSTLDASQDPFIPFYLIDHDQYQAVIGDFTSFVFASPGSGKSAFRVRLARDCRVGKNGRKIFPIVYDLFDPILVKRDRNLDQHTHYKNLAKSAAQELLLYLLYQDPSVVRDQHVLMEIRQAFDTNLPVDYLQQMVEKGSVKPLLVSFDQTAGLLPNPPSKKDIISLAHHLGQFRIAAPRILEPKQRFEQLTDIVLDKLGFDAIYILIDGVDGYVETGKDAQNGVQVISWLLENHRKWQSARIFSKYFLPAEMFLALQEKYGALLTSESKVTMIRWDADTLGEVIKQRLLEASGGKYSSLRAISSLPLRGAKQAPEEILAREIVRLGNPNPRDLIKTVNKLLIHHAENEVQEKLTPKDLAVALDWIRTERSLKTRHT